MLKLLIKFKIIVLIIFLISSCLTAGMNGDVLSAINALSYTEDELNIKIARSIFQGEINVEYIEIDKKIIGFIDDSQPDIIFISVPSVDDIDYVIELGSIISYFGFIIFNNGNIENIENEAYKHALNAYYLAKEKYPSASSDGLHGNRKYEEHLKGKIEYSKTNSYYRGGKYYWTADLKIDDNNVLLSYE